MGQFTLKIKGFGCLKGINIRKEGCLLWVAKVALQKEGGLGGWGHRLFLKNSES